MDPFSVSNDLGASRGGANSTNDKIDHSVGVELLLAKGDRVRVGEAWAKVHHSTSPQLPEHFVQLMQDALQIDSTQQDEEDALQQQQTKHTHIVKIMTHNELI